MSVKSERKRARLASKLLERGAQLMAFSEQVIARGHASKAEVMTADGPQFRFTLADDVPAFDPELFEGLDTSQGFALAHVDGTYALRFPSPFSDLVVPHGEVLAGARAERVRAALTHLRSIRVG